MPIVTKENWGKTAWCIGKMWFCIESEALMKFWGENVKSLGKILLVMYAATAICLFLLAALVERLGWENGAISVGISVVYVISCFLGGFLAGKVQKTRKFVWGILMGLLYVIVMLGITMIVKNRLGGGTDDFTMNLLLCLGGGMIGGMIS